MNQTVEKILNIFEGYRMMPMPNDEFLTKGKAILADKIETFVNNKKPIDFSMMGFPFKSTNQRDKVLGVLPDRAEEETLKNFKRFNEDIQSVYPLGMRLHMASDGFAFNELLGVSEKTVLDYKYVSQDLGKDAPVKWYDLNDFYSGSSIVDKQEKLQKQFGITPESLQQEILFNPDVNYLYRGMVIFMTEELAIKNFASGNQLHKAAKALAKEMMLRNEAYSALVRHEFSNMVRLSMHPSVNNGTKYSFQLIRSPKARHSAWHCALVVNQDGSLETMHRKDAEAKGYELQYKNNQPYYFLANQ